MCHPRRKGSAVRSLACFVALPALLVTLASGKVLANVCETDHLLCATTMPVDGYCQCIAHGSAEDGTVVAKAPPRRQTNATAGGCGAQPGAPGCR